MLTRDSGAPSVASTSVDVAPTLTAAISSTECSLTTGSSTSGVMGAEATGSLAAANSRRRAVWRVEAEAGSPLPDPPPNPPDAPDPPDAPIGAAGPGATAGAVLVTSTLGCGGLTTLAPVALEVLLSTSPKILPSAVPSGLPAAVPTVA